MTKIPELLRSGSGILVLIDPVVILYRRCMTAPQCNQ